jgi:uncharacterized protein (DUF58 family)
MTIMVGFGSINTGNNLLYLLLGMMLGLIIVSGVMSETMLRKVDVTRLWAGAVYAGRQARVDYQLRNRKRRFPSFSIEVRELERVESGRTRRKREKKPLDPSIPRTFCHHLAAGRETVRAGKVVLPKRGLYRYEAVELVTRFPFGFFEKSRRFERPAELLAFPRIVEAPDLTPPGERPDGTSNRPEAGRGDEYLGLRDYHSGEDWRRIHWKVTARRGELVVRENETERSRELSIALFNAVGEIGGGYDAEPVERAIEVAAALCRRFLRSGYSVGLITLDGSVLPGNGPGQYLRLMCSLALLEIHEDDGTLELPAAIDATPRLLVEPPEPATAAAGPR